MTIKLYGMARNNDNTLKLTEDKMYPIVKITYQKLFPEGLVTIVNDEGNLIRTSSLYFTFKTANALN